MASQADLIRRAMRQAKSMKSNEKQYLKGTNYKGHPVVVENSGHGNILVTHAGRNSNSTVAHVVNTKTGRTLHTSRYNNAPDSRIHGMKETIHLGSKRGSSPKASTGHSGG